MYRLFSSHNLRTMEINEIQQIVARLEEDDRRLGEEERRIAEQRRANRITADRFRAMLMQAKNTAPLLTLVEGPRVYPPSPPARLRVGAKRLKVLEAIADATADGHTLQTRDVANATGFKMDLCGNVIWDGVNNRKNLIKMPNGGVQMTEEGFAFLREVGSQCRGVLKRNAG